MTSASESWLDLNQRYLSETLTGIREVLDTWIADQSGAREELLALGDDPREALDPAPALETLCRLFGLSGFERFILLLCVGCELDSKFAASCARVQDNPQRLYPTFSLALAVFPNAHWSALSPAAPLRYWRLIETAGAGILTTSELRIDERVLNYLTGVSFLDERLRGYVHRLDTDRDLPPTHRETAARIKKYWLQPDFPAATPVIELYGGDQTARLNIVGHACRELGVPACHAGAVDLPGSPVERESLFRLWEREAMLSGSVLVIDIDDVEPRELRRTAAPFLQATRSPVIVTGSEPSTVLPGGQLRLAVARPPAREQLGLWRTVLGSRVNGFDGALMRISSQFNLDVRQIQACSHAVSDVQEYAPGDEQAIGAALWSACRTQTRAGFAGLAQAITPYATWDELVLPETQTRILKDIAIHVRHRTTVYEAWGFAGRSERGLGISTLFSGPSGTGKTMAAEVLANELELDLFRIDLSQVVNKYIGETEKNLRRLFDAAEAGGCILLFDEADALFGKRSEVRDAHDRHANIEVSYLLQRMEAYRGLAILTTNKKEDLDKAFLRRIRFVVHFPFPDAVQRTEIWRSIFPADTPTDDLDIKRLSNLNITGGSIRNIALNAAFYAADHGEPVGMADILRAVRHEYAKLEKPLTETDVKAWK